MDKECKKRLENIAEKFKTCRRAVTALGDETRQLIILALLESDYSGIRVGEIAQKTHLSRPAVSHHLKILRDAEIVNMRREGTRNFYFLDAERSHWKAVKDLIDLVYEGIAQMGEHDARKGGD